jgi:hypothetical protein
VLRLRAAALNSFDFCAPAADLTRSGRAAFQRSTTATFRLTKQINAIQDLESAFQALFYKAIFLRHSKADAKLLRAIA